MSYRGLELLCHAENLLRQTDCSGVLKMILLKSKIAPLTIVKEHPIIIVVTLAAMAVGAVMGVIAFYQG